VGTSLHEMSLISPALIKSATERRPHLLTRRRNLSALSQENAVLLRLTKIGLHKTLVKFCEDIILRAAKVVQLFTILHTTIWRYQLYFYFFYRLCKNFYTLTPPQQHFLRLQLRK
jgi:hypothetical protein